MPTTLTNYYDIEKPELDGSPDDWGRILNEGLDKIDAALRDCLQSKTQPAYNTPLTANVSQLPIYVPTQDSNVLTHSQLLATQGWIEGRILFYMNKFLPVGTILMWYGAFGTVPAGWTFCDGTLNSPDLRGRFVLCANNATPVVAPGARDGVLTTFPGEHIHQTTYQIYPGPSTGQDPPPVAVNNSKALYSGTANTLPYIAQMYIMKYAAW